MKTECKFRIGDKVRFVNGEYTATVTALKQPPFIRHGICRLIPVITFAHGTTFSINEDLLIKVEENNEKVIE